MLILKSPYKQELSVVAKWLLSSRPTLDLRLFNEQNQMHQQIIKDLLRLTNIFIAENLNKFPEFEVIDIILCGSAASYVYSEFSDVNIDIVINEKTCSFLSSYENNNKNLFFEKLALLQILKKRYYNINGSRKVRFSIKTKTNYLAGAYSLKQQKWINEPNKNFVSGLTEAEMLAEAQKVINELIYLGYKKAEKNSGKYSLDVLLEMDEFYQQIIKNKNLSVQDYIIHNLVKYSGRLFKFRRFYINEIAKSLSI